MDASSSATLTAAVGSLRDWQGLSEPQQLEVQQLLDAFSISPLSPPSVLQVARRFHTTPYPPNWSEEVDNVSGALYFYNELKDESSWEHPLADCFRDILALVGTYLNEKLHGDALATRIEQSLAEAQTRAAEELADWVGPIPADTGDEGEYFYNARTGESVWEDPRTRWQYELHVRYDILVGFLVDQENEAKPLATSSPAPAPWHASELTPTLTSLASTLSSINSSIALAMTPPHTSPTNSDVSERWAQPRTPRFGGGLKMPPRMAGDGAKKAIYALPPHQQRYATDMLSAAKANMSSSQNSNQSTNAPPPPPPPGAPPRSQPLNFGIDD